MTDAALPPATLYPELDEAALGAFAAALESGDTSALPAARAAEAAAALSLVVFGRVRIPGADGDELDGALWRHTDTRPRPVVVMPSPWANQGWVLYAVQASLFAAQGYHVLAYTARGFGRSGGAVDVAGPLDVLDGSRALDFVAERVRGPVTKVGFLGDSYGSGISQLVAAHDERVDAVAALSSWGDLGAAFLENSTRHIASVKALLKAAEKARLSEETAEVFANVLGNRETDRTLEWARRRSPYTYRAELNRRRVPVFYAHAWHETLFPPNQMLKMFAELTGPKRIDLSVGDHSGPEMSGMLGLPNRIWTDAHRWFGHHLKGDGGSGIGDEGQVLSQIMWNTRLEPSTDLDAFTGQQVRLHPVGGPEGGDGTLSPKPEGGWTTRVLTGTDTPATVADAVITGGYAEMAGRPKVYETAVIDRTVAGVWVSAPLDDTLRLRGVPHLRMTYTAGTTGSTFIAYLLDVGPDGDAHLVTHAPFTDLDTPAGQPVTAGIDLQAVGYDVPARHRLLLAVDARDPFYGDANLPRTTLAFTSPEGDPARLDLPVA
ncbi:alpha/beta hydrolase [Streptomyces bambusae]|uniref:alpha/beta fold hydrolase n=1 Tax=Streptomyces bambusae TaxID=1550616 RepID=UPI001CFF2683|nr:alpha/beta fold hydrolase [Streptomyces bambusae]MCB5167612.1 alpha/beta hydrolase [Streptomyces bambusae]